MSVASIRAQIQETAAELNDLTETPRLDADSIKRRVDAYVDRLGGSVTVIAHDFGIEGRQLVEHELFPGQPTGMAALAWLHPDKLKEKLTALALEATPSGQSPAEIKERRAALAAKLKKLEADEEAEIRKLEAKGQVVVRRGDADPRAVLGLD